MKKLENVEKKTSESGAASGKSCPLSAASYATCGPVSYAKIFDAGA